MKYLVNIAHIDSRFVDALPTALIKPLSGSGARGMMIDTMTTFGADSFPARLAAILQGSSDTTFYVIAVYFGAVGVRNTRYTVGAMLLADLVGIVTSILLAYWFLDKKFAGFKKIFIPLSSLLCGRLYKTFPQKHTKG